MGDLNRWEGWKGTMVPASCGSGKSAPLPAGAHRDPTSGDLPLARPELKHVVSILTTAVWLPDLL